jgi:hypothetical protein
MRNVDTTFQSIDSRAIEADDPLEGNRLNLARNGSHLSPENEIYKRFRLHSLQNKLGLTEQLYFVNVTNRS